MNLNLKIDPKFYLEYLVEKRIIRNGIQYIFKFPNNYGASVVKFRGTAGYKADKWELAVLFFHDGIWDLTYNTPITDDIVGCLTDEEVEQYLNKIMELPEA